MGLANAWRQRVRILERFGLSWMEWDGENERVGKSSEGVRLMC